jgi:hypothetical protein
VAIKGKKKSQSRGSQARRRPAAMPKPVATVRKPKWYQTTAGLSIASIGGILALILAIWIFNTVRTSGREADAIKQQLESYTGSVKSALQLVTPAATDMSQAATADPKTVAEDAKTWVKTLQDAQTQLSGAVPPPEAQAAHQIFQQSIEIFKTAASVLELAADLPTDTATKLVATTLAEVSVADGVWGTAVNALDDARAAAGLGSAALRSPINSDPAAQPSPLATVPVDSGASPGSGSGGGKGNGKGKNGGGGNV